MVATGKFLFTTSVILVTHIKHFWRTKFWTKQSDMNLCQCSSTSSMTSSIYRTNYSYECVRDTFSSEGQKKSRMDLFFTSHGKERFRNYASSHLSCILVRTLATDVPFPREGPRYSIYADVLLDVGRERINKPF